MSASWLFWMAMFLELTSFCTMDFKQILNCFKGKIHFSLTVVSGQA